MSTTDNYWKAVNVGNENAFNDLPLEEKAAVINELLENMEAGGPVCYYSKGKVWIGDDHCQYQVAENGIQDVFKSLEGLDNRWPEILVTDELDEIWNALSLLEENGYLIAR